MNSRKALLLRSVDAYLGKLLVFLLPSVFSNSVRVRISMNNIAVIRLWAIGESILSLPAINAVAQAHPSAKITVITMSYVAPVFQKQESIDEVVLLQANLRSLIGYAIKNRRRFDAVLDFEPYLYTSALLAWVVGKWRVGFDTRSRGKLYDQSVVYNDQQHVVRTNLDLAKAVGANKKYPRLPFLNFSKQDKIMVDEVMHGINVKRGQDFLLLSPGVGGSALYRMWPWQRFAQLADKLIDDWHKKVIWIGEPKDKTLLNKIQKMMTRESEVISDLSLCQLFYLVSQAQLLIANDSGVMHIGAAMRTPTLGLFGPNTPVRFGPFGKNNKAIYRPITGSPCINVHKGEIPVTDKQCAKSMLAISVNEVSEAAGQMLLKNF